MSINTIPTSTTSMTSMHIPRILLVESNPLLRQMIQTMIQILGAKCTCTDQAAEALDLFKQGYYDLALIDLGLAQISGFELVQHMRSSESMLGAARTPIIGNATLANPEEVEPLCLAAGMDAVYPKLSSLQDVYEVLTQWLDHPLVMPVHLLDVHVPASKCA